MHHSNIYSGAPMPYMQRITWSGVAIHAGVLPGYPASHGCIRMPMAFAVKMWNWTRMGARVVITPGEMTPASFSHSAACDAQKVAAASRGADEPKVDAADAGHESRQGAAGGADRPSIREASLELRPTLGLREDWRSGTHHVMRCGAVRSQDRASDQLDRQLRRGTMTDATAGRDARPQRGCQPS